MLTICDHYLYREKGSEKKHNTTTLAIIFLTVKFSVVGTDMMIESRGKKVDTSLQGDNN